MTGIINLLGGLEHFLWPFHILGIIIPTDLHMFQRGRYTTNQKWWNHWLFRSRHSRNGINTYDWYYKSAWWFGTFFMTFHILGIIIPTDLHMFQRGRYTTNQKWWNHWLFRSRHSRNGMNTYDWYYKSAWWFGTFFMTFHILGIIIPTDLHMFQRGRYTTNQKWWNHWLFRSRHSRKGINTYDWYYKSACWFGTFFVTFHILGIIIPTDFHMFQRGRYTTNQKWWNHWLFRSIDSRNGINTYDWYYKSAWWFGTFFVTFHILGIIIPTDFHMFQRGRYTTNQKWWNHWLFRSIDSRNGINTYDWYYKSACWFGTFFVTFHILGIIIPTDFHMFQRGRYTTNQKWWNHWLFRSIDSRNGINTN